MLAAKLPSCLRISRSTARQQSFDLLFFQTGIILVQRWPMLMRIHTVSLATAVQCAVYTPSGN